jgi:hypothetical protein
MLSLGVPVWLAAQQHLQDCLACHQLLLQPLLLLLLLEGWALTALLCQ